MTDSKLLLPQTPREFYEGYRKRHADPLLQLGWTSHDMQLQNFDLMLEMLDVADIPVEGLTLHDAGCGHGDLLERLTGMHEPREYVGTDFMDEPLVLARVRHPKQRFLRRDMRVEQLPVADITLAFGSLAFHSPRAVEEVLENLWKHTEVALGFTTWWDLPEEYVGGDRVEQLKRVVNRFIKRGVHAMRHGSSYNEPTEAMFLVLK